MNHDHHLGGLMPNKYVGQRVKRTEDPRLIKGLAHYVDDIRLPDTLHVSFRPFRLRPCPNQ